MEELAASEFKALLYFIYFYIFIHRHIYVYARWGLTSPPRQLVTGQKRLKLCQGRFRLDIGGTSSLEGLFIPGMDCPGSGVTIIGNLLWLMSQGGIAGCIWG